MVNNRLVWVVEQQQADVVAPTQFAFRPFLSAEDCLYHIGLEAMYVKRQIENIPYENALSIDSEMSSVYEKRSK